MSPAFATAAAGRLARLERYLQEDPANDELLADACETALAAGMYQRALEHAANAEALTLDPPVWRFRRARICIAMRDLPQARTLLEAIHLENAKPVVAHDLAYVAFLAGDLARCRAVLAPWLLPHVEGTEPSATRREALQVLWLRTLHREGALREGVDWALAEEAAARLQPSASGVASLLALDADDLDGAERFADAALPTRPQQPEALVARACVALARRGTADARRLLARALEVNAEDGRTWSAAGLASLQAGELARAQSEFESAVQWIPKHVGTWHALGWSRLFQGDRDGALQAFEQALSLDRNFAESHGGVGLLLAMAGRMEDAEHHLEVAARLDPLNVTGRFAHAWLAGKASDGAQLQRLARGLLDRPGFGGRRLADALRF
jgi:Flp pilus assembly protein TadD